MSCVVVQSPAWSRVELWVPSFAAPSVDTTLSRCSSLDVLSGYKHLSIELSKCRCQCGKGSAVIGEICSSVLHPSGKNAKQIN